LKPAELMDLLSGAVAASSERGRLLLSSVVDIFVQRVAVVLWRLFQDEIVRKKKESPSPFPGLLPYKLLVPRHVITLSLLTKQLRPL
jgi:hypothetical protein